MRRIQGFLGTVAVGIRVVTIRVVIVGCACIHCVQNNPKDAAFDAGKKVAGARECFLGSFTGAHYEKNPICLDLSLIHI